MNIMQFNGLSESEDWGDVCESYKRLPANVVLTELKEEEDVHQHEEA